MKKSILFGAFALVFGAATFTSCSSEATHEKSHEGEHMEATSYYCPMKCEGEKTYEEPGSCPVCGMDLVEVK